MVHQKLVNCAFSSCGSARQADHTQLCAKNERANAYTMKPKSIKRRIPLEAGSRVEEDLHGDKNKKSSQIDQKT